MMKTTLIIMAAGIGSRFGTGIKQLAKMGPYGEIIMDYSIHDAKEAGFDKVVIIIRKDIEEEFKQVIGDRIGKYMDVEYVFQDINDLPDGFCVPEGRSKPWGTGQAVLCCKDIVKEPFAIINADDYYGKEAFHLLHDFLVEPRENSDQLRMGMAGFILKNTLSENGKVTRGLCLTDSDYMLTDVFETTGIGYNENHELVCDRDDVLNILSEDVPVSMNMWAGDPDFFEYLEKGFVDFLNHIDDNDLKAEYLLPIIIDGLLKNNQATVKVMKTSDKWIGITYKEDTEIAQRSFKEMIDEGVYSASLWEE